MVQNIIKRIADISGEYSGYEIFSDWIKASAIGISNSVDLIHGRVWERRENEYMDILNKHGAERMRVFAEMLGMLAMALEDNVEDVLGRIYMEAGLGNKNTGQFFTPFHLSYAVAAAGIPEDFSGERPFTINEPSSGGGGMIIAAAKILKERGIDYQKCMNVVAQDLDWKGVYMTYVQLSLLGIKAKVVQGNTLSEPFIRVKDYPPERILYTPAEKGVLR